MAVGIVSAEKRGELLRLEVCGDLREGACACGRAHVVLEYPGPPRGQKIPSDWVETCVREALLLLEPVAEVACVPLPELVGRTLSGVK